MKSEKGMALVLSMFLTMAMSIVGAALMFLSQTETYTSMNYRLMSQARYGAESGIQVAANYLMNSYQAPSTTGGANGDVITNYNTTVSPVTYNYNGQPVVLSANSAVPSNYPIAAVQAAFAAVAQGTMTLGRTTVAYAPYARLLSMQEFDAYGGVKQTIQTWEIASAGSISVGRTARVEVTAVLETQKGPAQMYAAFATSGGCGALTFGGASVTDSYDSGAALVGGVPVLSNTDGDVGTNGNLGESGNAVINGSLSTPRVGVGACSEGNVDALTQSGNATVTGGIVQLPQAVTLPAPTPPTLPGALTTWNGNGQTLLGGSYNYDIVVNGTSNLTLGAVGTTSIININSLALAGNSTITILGTVILNVLGAGQTTPISLTGNGVINSSFDASTFQIQYAGTGNIALKGSSTAAAVVYAPSATASLTGGSDFYGSIIASRLVDTGGTHIHYDRRLSSEFFAAASPMLSSFSWKKS